MSKAKSKNGIFGSIGAIGLVVAVVSVDRAGEASKRAEEQSAEVTRVLTMILRDAPADPASNAQKEHVLESAKLLVKLKPGEPIAQLAQATQLFFSEDYEAALPLFIQAAEAGERQAQFMLGTMYARELGVGEDKAETLRWYKLAASAGHASACWQVGLRYEHGLGVQEDMQEAIEWYEKGLEDGNERARNALKRLGAR